MFDLGPATDAMTRLVRDTTDDDLDRPTPCDRWTVSDLLAHVHQFATVFTDNARKRPTAPPATLVPDWRTAIPAQLDELAAAWTEEAAWQGRVSAGGVEMEAADNAVVAVEELTVHGWDLARATGRSLQTTAPTLDRVERFFALFPATDVFGPRFRPDMGDADRPPSGDDLADRLAGILARTGRNPDWR